MTAGISHEETAPNYQIAYALQRASYEEISRVVQVDSVPLAVGIRFAVSSYLTKIPGILEFGASSPTKLDMDQWLDGQDESLLKISAPLSPEPAGRNYRTFLRFLPAEGFAISALTRGRMRHHEPELLELTDKFPRSYRVKVDDAFIAEMQQWLPEMGQDERERLEQMSGQVITMKNPNPASRYLDWDKINQARERHAGFYVDDAILAYSVERQQDPEFAQERTRLIEERQRSLPPLLR